MLYSFIVPVTLFASQGKAESNFLQTIISSNYLLVLNTFYIIWLYPERCQNHKSFGKKHNINYSPGKEPKSHIVEIFLEVG